MIRINEMILSTPASSFLIEMVESIAADPARSFVVREGDARELRSALRAAQEEETGAAVDVDPLLKSDAAAEDDRLVGLMLREPCKANGATLLERIAELRAKLEAQSGKADAIERNQARAWIETFRFLMNLGMDRFISRDGTGIGRVKEWTAALYAEHRAMKRVLENLIEGRPDAMHEARAMVREVLQ